MNLNTPIQLSDTLCFATNDTRAYDLRSAHILTPIFTRTVTGDLTFPYFFTKFINNILYDDIKINRKLFNVRIKNNDILLLQKFYY